jgi:DNA-3-methyladenine glycosylase II
MTGRREIGTRGPFSLRSAAEFGFGPNRGKPPPFDGAMRLAFPMDGGSGYAGAVLRQPDGDGRGPLSVDLELAGGADADAAMRQIARVISLDGDGEAFQRVGEHDPEIGRLQRAHPGQRPVLFHSPYEGAAWSIISARRPSAQAARTRTNLGGELGHTFDLDGETLHAFPLPGQLAGLDEATGATLGLEPERATRLRTVATAALEGRLDVERLHELGPEAAYTDLQGLKGIGPFYAGLIVLRATGFHDAILATAEPRVLGHAARLYGHDQPPTLEWFTETAEAWRPFRTWAMVLIRLAGDRGTF